jgi:hypothetical protein
MKTRPSTGNFGTVTQLLEQMSLVSMSFMTGSWPKQ